MHALLRKRGSKPQRSLIDEVVRVGDNTLVISSVAYVYPIGISGMRGTVDVAIVCECPPLSSNNALKELGVFMGCLDETMTVRVARAYDQPIECLA